MERLTYTQREWQAIAQELAGRGGSPTTPGLVERIAAMLREAPGGWPEQSYTLELDAGAAEAVRAALTPRARPSVRSEQQAASVAEAEAIIRAHQQRPEDRRTGEGA